GMAIGASAGSTAVTVAANAVTGFARRLTTYAGLDVRGVSGLSASANTVNGPATAPCIWASGNGLGRLDNSIFSGCGGIQLGAGQANSLAVDGRYSIPLPTGSASASLVLPPGAHLRDLAVVVTAAGSGSWSVGDSSPNDLLAAVSAAAVGATHIPGAELDHAVSGTSISVTASGVSGASGLLLVEIAGN
ncbi:MAG: hypothetical protein ACREJM_10420, partial [Candidatus Saccharimonadales bacterium]